jgi:hypothetical protein
MLITLKEYHRYDKIISENEPEFLKDRLENWGFQDYRRWFSDTNIWVIRDTLKNERFSHVK